MVVSEKKQRIKRMRRGYVFCSFKNEVSYNIVIVYFQKFFLYFNEYDNFYIIQVIWDLDMICIYNINGYSIDLKKNFVMYVIVYMCVKICMILIRYGLKLLVICEMMYCFLVNFKYQIVIIYYYYCSFKFQYIKI